MVNIFTLVCRFQNIIPPFAVGMCPGGAVFGVVDSSGISRGTTTKYVNCTCKIR